MRVKHSAVSPFCLSRAVGGRKRRDRRDRASPVLSGDNNPGSTGNPSKRVCGDIRPTTARYNFDRCAHMAKAKKTVRCKPCGKPMPTDRRWGMCETCKNKARRAREKELESKSEQEREKHRLALERERVAKSNDPEVKRHAERVEAYARRFEEGLKIFVNEPLPDELLPKDLRQLPEGDMDVCDDD